MQNEEKAKRKYQKFNLRSGDVFNRLTFTGKTTFIQSGGKSRRMIEAKCECGVIKYYDFDIVKRGDVKSCGCYKADLFKIQPNHVTHGLRNHRLYSIWRGMKDRCLNPNHTSYPRYGGKGVTVCKEWVEDFMAFYNWAISNGYRFDLTLDRKINKEGYNPENCRFASYAGQRRNSSQIIWITAWSETKCLKDWSDDPRCKVSEKGLRNRFGRDKDKWPIPEEAISSTSIDHSVQRVTRKSNHFVVAFGEKKIIADWANDPRCNVGQAGLRKRLKKAASPEEAITGVPFAIEDKG